MCPVRVKHEIFFSAWALSTVQWLLLAGKQLASISEY